MDRIGVRLAVLLLDSAAGLLVARMSRRVVVLAGGDQARWLSVYTLMGAVFTLPTVLLGTYLLGIAAGHRLGERSRRWILLGMGIYAVVRTATVLASTPSPELNLTKATIVGGIFVTVPLMVGIALLGARRARRTQSAFYAQLYFRRLGAADQAAALALLDESVRSAASPVRPDAATPSAAAPSNDAGSSAPPRPGRR